MTARYFHDSTPDTAPKPSSSSWTAHRCINCGQSFAGRGAWKATERFFTHPKHRECIERWYPIVDVPSAYSQIGTKR